MREAGRCLQPVSCQSTVCGSRHGRLVATVVASVKYAVAPPSTDHCAPLLRLLRLWRLPITAACQPIDHLLAMMHRMPHMEMHELRQREIAEPGMLEEQVVRPRGQQPALEIEE